MLVITNVAKQYREAIPMYEIKLPKIVKELTRYVSQQSTPKKTLTDIGMNFIPAQIQKAHNIFVVKQVLTA